MAFPPPTPRYNFRAVAAVGLIFGAIELLVAARFLGKMFGAREDLALVQVTYQLSAPLAAPFWAIFGKPGLHLDADAALLAALVVYGVIGLGMAGLVRIVTTRHSRQKK